MYVLHCTPLQHDVQWHTIYEAFWNNVFSSSDTVIIAKGFGGRGAEYFWEPVQQNSIVPTLKTQLATCSHADIYKLLNTCRYTVVSIQRHADSYSSKNVCCDPSEESRYTFHWSVIGWESNTEVIHKHYVYKIYTKSIIYTKCVWVSVWM